MIFTTLLNYFKNPFIQVAIPFLITSIIFIIIIIKRRHFKLKSILLSLAVIAVAVIFALLGGKGFANREGEETYVEQSKNNEYIANELLLEESYELAGDVVDSIRKEQGTKPVFTLLMARINTLMGNLPDAVATYTKAKNEYLSQGLTDFPEDEFEKTTTYYNTTYNSNKDASMIAYLTASGKNPADYGYTITENTTSDITLEDLYDMIGDNVSESQDALLNEDPSLEPLSHVSSLIAEMETVYNQYLIDGFFDAAIVEKLEKRLNSAIEENPQILGNKFARLARLKAMTLNGSYKKIAATANQFSSDEELMIISELYVTGRIKESHFNEEYATIDEKKYQAVIDQCNNVAYGALNKERKSTRTKYKESIKGLDKALDNKALVTTVNLMIDNIDTSDASLRSKEYLQLAKIEQYLDMPAKANEYISLSISMVGDSEDMNYAQPMYEIVGIISGTSENGSEDVKNVADYVNQVLDNSLPFKLATPVQNEGDDFGASTEEDTDNFVQLSAIDSEDSQSEEPVNEPDSAKSFDQFFTNVVSEKMATINIGTINKDNFPNVKARIQVQSDSITNLEDFKELVTINDCNRIVSDYTVEKLQYQKSRIILLCDVSGSMVDNVENLKYAVTSFAEKMETDEEICVVGFDDYVKFDTGFSSNPQDIMAAADSIGAFDGTNMYSALLQVGGNFTSDVNINNIVILMTDGQDNNPVDQSEINNTLGALVANNSFTVYTLGLGAEVDTNYLEMIAEAGNGSFIYVPDSVSLDNFFDFVHQQTSNQYVISYEAKNKTSNKRTLEVEIPKEYASKEKTYYLVEPEYVDNMDNTVTNIISESEAQVYGLKGKVVYKSDIETTNYLNGEGFKAGDDISIQINGKISYDLTPEYISDTSIKVTIPYGLAIGTYDLEVTINDEIHTLEKELTIAVQGTEKYFKFGDYSFTCLNSSINDYGETQLTGNVIMNGWLYFKGDLVISGDIVNSDRVTITDNTGAYISYNSATSTGLAGYLAKKGISMPLGILGSFGIFKDEYDPSDYASFRVESIYDSSIINVNFLKFENATVSLYPDMVYLNNFKINFDYPFQEELTGKLPADDVRRMDYDTGLAATATTIGFDAKFKYEAPEAEDGEEVRFAVMPLWLSEFETNIDTFHNNYDLLMKVKLKAFKSMDSMGFDFTILDGKFDGITLYADFPVTLQRVPVPISLNNFSLGFSGYSDRDSKDFTLDQLLGITVKAGFDADFAKVTDVLPKVAEFLDLKKKDEIPPVVRLSDCTIEATLAKLDFNFKADMNFLGMFDFGKVEVNLGRFSYLNELLSLNSFTQNGLRAKLILEQEWKTSNCKLDLNGSLEAVLGYPYTGINGGVAGEAEAKWWIFSVNKDFAGDLLVGFFENSYKQIQFNAIARAGSDGNYTGFRAYVSPAEGFNIDKY